MSKNSGLNFKTFVPQLRKYLRIFSTHSVFAAVLVVLLAYVFVVWRIGQLAGAEPTPDQLTSNISKIPVVDKTAINQIQSLEQNNTNVHSLFESARNNPFQE